jgi:hypothetical protein
VGELFVLARYAVMTDGEQFHSPMYHRSFPGKKLATVFEESP